MLNILILLTSLTLIGAASCERHKPPKIEQCIIGDEGCICHDPRISDDPYDLTFEECVNYIATNPDDYNTMKKWVDSKLKRLIKCEDRQ